MRLVFLHLFIAFILLTDYFNYQSLKNKPFYKQTQMATWVKKSRTQLRKKIKNKSYREFLISLVSGEKRGFKKTKEFLYFKKASLLHILTPSGIHLSSLTLPLFILIKSPLLRLLILFLLGGFIFSSPHLFSAQRILVFKSMKTFKLSNITSFYLTFSLFLIFHGNLSFILSFLFLGLIILNPRKEILPTLYLLFLAQLLICFFFKQDYYPLTFVINPIITLLVSLSFPLYLISFIFPSLSLITLPISKIIFTLSSLIESIPIIFPASFISFLFFLSFSIKLKKKYRFLFFILFIFQARVVN